jgi:hypothetical protein
VAPRLLALGQALFGSVDHDRGASLRSASALHERAGTTPEGAYSLRGDHEIGAGSGWNRLGARALRRVCGHRRLRPTENRKGERKIERAQITRNRLTRTLGLTSIRVGGQRREHKERGIGWVTVAELLHSSRLEQ